MSHPDPRYDSYEFELEDLDEVEPVQMCGLCHKRPIWAFQIALMKKGRRGVCQKCRGIHVWEDGSVVMKGFKA